MKSLEHQNEINGLEDVALMKKILGMQEFTSEIEKILKSLVEESNINEWPLVVLEAYSLGVISGKRNERNKKYRINT